MSSVAEKKGQAVQDALAKTDDVKPAVTTEENEELKQYSKALLEQAIEIGKDNEHYGKYNFVQLPYAKLQNGSEHHEHVGLPEPHQPGILTRCCVAADYIPLIGGAFFAPSCQRVQPLTYLD